MTIEVCFNYVVEIEEASAGEKIERIWEGFIEAVEAEGGSAGGGHHNTGDQPVSCETCKEAIDAEARATD